MTGFFSRINVLLPSESPFSNIDFPPLLLITTTYTYKGFFFSEKVTIQDRQDKQEKKKLPQKYCQTWCNKVRCHCPKSCLSVYATCKSSIPNLGTHQGFFFGPKDHQVKRSCSFFLEKKIQSL